MTLYFDAVDTAGHHFGPDSAELNAAVTEVDARIGDLLSGLKDLDQPVRLLVVADHGMHAISDTRIVDLADLIDLPSIIAVETGPYAAIEPAAGTDDRVYDALLKPHDHMTCRRREDLPERLHYGHNPRVAAIICIAGSACRSAPAACWRSATASASAQRPFSTAGSTASARPACCRCSSRWSAASIWR